MKDKQLQLRFLPENKVRIQNFVAGKITTEEEITLESEDMELAFQYLKRLNLWRFTDNRLVSQHIVVDGFEPWWFSQEYLFGKIIVPFSRYRSLIHLWFKSDSVEVIEPPSDFAHLIGILVDQSHVPPLKIITCKEHSPSNSQPRKSRNLQQTLVKHSLTSLVKFILNRPKVLLYTVDKVTPELGYDFRLKAIYQELANRQESFAEYVHRSDRNAVLNNLDRRKRPVLFFECLAPRIGRSLQKLSRKLPKSSKPIAVKPADPDSIFLAAAARHGLNRANSSASMYEGLKILLRLHRPKYALIMDDSRHTHALVAACKALKIPTVGYQHGLNINKYFAGLSCPGWNEGRPHTPNIYGLWSEYFRDKLLSFSELYRAENTFVCGNLRPPTDDELAQLNSKVDKVEQNFIRVLLISEPKAKPEELIPAVEQLLTDDRFIVSLKLRPGEDLDPVNKLFGFMASQLKKVSKATVYQAFTNADVVVGMYSSVLYEAILALKPVVILKSSSPFAPNLAERNLAELVECPDATNEIVIRASNLPRDELIRRRELLWGKGSAGEASLLFAAAEAQLIN